MTITGDLAPFTGAQYNRWGSVMMQDEPKRIGRVSESAERPQRLRRAALLRNCLLLVAFVAGGGLFGRVISLIPSPSEVTMFWVSNLSSPWLVLAFLAGRSQRSKIWAVGAGALADVASIVGFYAQFLFIYANPGGPLIRATPLSPA